MDLKSDSFPVVSLKGGCAYFKPSQDHFSDNQIHLYCQYQVKRLPYNINDQEFADALVAAFLELHHASGTSQQRDVPTSQSLHIQTIKPKLVRSPTDHSRAKPGLLFFDIRMHST